MTVQGFRQQCSPSPSLAETMEDKGKMLYLTLEKAPHVTGLGPWMGVVVGEEQMDSNYPEEQKVLQQRGGGETILFPLLETS